MQKSEMTKENYIFLCISECSLPYLKVVQKSEISKGNAHFLRDSVTSVTTVSSYPLPHIISSLLYIYYNIYIKEI